MGPSHCLFQTLCVYVSYPGFKSGVCGSFAPISPLEQSGTGRLASWLAAQERKRSLSNSRWRTACAYTAEKHAHTCMQADVHACNQANSTQKHRSCYLECDRTSRMNLGNVFTIAKTFFFSGRLFCPYNFSQSLLQHTHIHTHTQKHTNSIYITLQSPVAL